MNDNVTAIGLIVDMIPMLKTLTGTRRREYFEKMIKPLYESLEEVHIFYNDLFIETVDSLGKLRPPIWSDDKSYNEEKAKGIINSLILKRRKDEAVRNTIRYEAGDIFKSIRWKEEKRFVTIVANYFLEEGGLSPTVRQLDDEIEMIERKGGEIGWDTPIRQLYGKLEKSRDLEEMISIVNRARDEINQSYINVIRGFRAVQSEIIKST